MSLSQNSLGGYQAVGDYGVCGGAAEKDTRKLAHAPQTGACPTSCLEPAMVSAAFAAGLTQTHLNIVRLISFCLLVFGFVLLYFLFL